MAPTGCVVRGLMAFLAMSERGVGAGGRELGGAVGPYTDGSPKVRRRGCEGGGAPLFFSDVAEHGDGGPGELWATGGAFDAEQGSDGIKELLGAPVLDWEDLAAEA